MVVVGAASPAGPPPTPVLILDNGAYNIKAGIAGVDWEPKIIPNSIARSRAEKKVYVADEIETCRDLSSLAYRRPFERGMLVNWDAEKIIWDRINPTETSLLVTEPYFNLPNIAETYDQMVFEEWEFASYYRTTAAALMPYGGLFEDDAGVPPECSLMIDLGYSYTHVIPVRGGEVVWEHVKRIDIGGKLLTNHLKHLISFRQWNMIDQTAIVDAVRETCGYVSMDYKHDLEVCKQNPKKNAIVQEYVLPDFSPNSTSRTGYIRSGPGAEIPPPVASAKLSTQAPPAKSGSGPDEEEQVLYMGNERFAGPELLFHPSDIGLKQSGLPETVAFVIEQMPQELQGMFWANIGIFGGLGMLPNLGERLERDLRALCPTGYEIGIFEAFETSAPPYHAAHILANSPTYLSTHPVTRAEYLEHGSGICRRRFGGPAYSVNPPGFQSGMALAEMDDDERERQYALGLMEISRGKGKGKKRDQEEEVVSGNWGGRRRRAVGMM